MLKIINFNVLFLTNKKAWKLYFLSAYQGIPRLPFSNKTFHAATYDVYLLVLENGNLKNSSYLWNIFKR